ncbi:1-aminocyclopropane-1-carboxylate deaminase/D-cysteine desulfhydrase [Agaribacterium sp. ZY112]|uniref:1-aminocyclopropane-1-carboxylate deaminase/D-cysteine desulfhydrase n=1 Tax=Agaribacterium sp. ZY112 TaxID=3233574 RepID=UPI0035243C3A
MRNPSVGAESLPLLAVNQRLNWDVAERAGVELWLRRDDAIDPELSGNKLYKLFGHLRHYQCVHLPSLSESEKRACPMVSFGGAFSNHLHALACAGQRLGIATVGIIRGQRPAKPSATLVDLEAKGMRLYFISRSDYRLRHDQAFVTQLLHDLNLASFSFVVPEGGAGELGLLGLQALGRHLATEHWHGLVCACGTGTTMQGLAQGLASAGAKHCSVLGVSALAAGDSVCSVLRPAMQQYGISWGLSNQFHDGGFARVSKDLSSFKQAFEAQCGVELDRVYTLKMFSALRAWLHRGMFHQGQRVLAIHSGGLQGNRGLV